MENEIMYIKLDDIIPNRFQPREVFNEEELNKLADSIKQHGVIEPIIVRPVSNKYEIIAGERRYKASVLAGLTKIPAIVKQLDDKESSIIAFIENEHRSDVSAIEEARTMERILEANNMTQEELAKELGVNQSTIANKLRLLNLPIEVQEALMHKEISERHARSLLSVKDEAKQIELLNKIKEKRMTVRELDSEIKSMNENMNGLNDNFGGVNYDSYMNNGPAAPSVNNGFNKNDYLNNNSAPVAPTEPTMPEFKAPDDDFMKFLNDFDSTHPAPASTPIPEPEEPVGGGSDLLSFLNNYDANYKSPSKVQEEAAVVNEKPLEAPSMNVLSNDDLAHPLSSVENEPSVNNTQETGNSDFMSFLNNYDANYKSPSMETPAPSEPAVAPAPQAAPNDDFMSFLNNYDANYKSPAEAPAIENSYLNEPLPQAPVNEPVPPQEPATQAAPNDDFMSFLNNYDANYKSPTAEAPATENSYLNEPLPQAPVNETIPPQAPISANQYVEDSANYVDVSKQEKISDVKTIIDKLGNVIKEIKDKSVFKVDTEEIDYDDLYQITIKIDKRDF